MKFKLIFALFPILAISIYAATLTWDDNSTNELGFEVERTLKGGAFQRIASVPANTKTYVDSTPEAGKTYQYRVRAVNASGASGYTNVAEWVEPVPAKPVTNFALALLRITSITPEGNPSWNALFTYVDTNTDETGYRLEYRKQTDPADAWLIAATNAANTTQITSPFFTDANVPYHWRLVTLRGAEGAVAVSATVISAGALTFIPNTPTNLKLAK